jgi:hypothetical protein
MFIEKRTKVLDRQYHDSTAVLKVRIGRRQVDQLLAGGGGAGGRMTIDGLPPHEALKTIWSNGAAAPEPRTPPHHQLWHAPEPT